MASENQNNDLTDFPDDIVSLVDFVDEQSRLQEDASAVLGDSDEQNCTYSKGYMQRQALYACATCSPAEPAGICLACSYICHDGHTLYELYTKRNFRCDCGNIKFADNKCRLVHAKDVVNSNNCYNQNFNGTYCTCARPYPDPEDEIEDEMIMCVVCEDWFHGRHLGRVPLDHEDYEEMVCAGCMTKHPFLWAYQLCSQDVAVLRESSDAKVDVEKGETGTIKEEMSVETAAESVVAASSYSSTAGNTSQPPIKRLKSENGDGEDGMKPEHGELETCFLRDLQKRDVTVKNHAAFWSDRWRQKLCRCSQCMVMYVKRGLEFLLDQEDTMYAYEERGRQRTMLPSESQLEQSALASMNHVQKIEVIQGYNEMKMGLRKYLQSFAENGNVVTAEDIKTFFADLQKRKKKQMPTLQYNCK